MDRLREDVKRLEALLAEHREREANLRNTLLTAQRLADEIRQNAQNEAKVIIREAEGRGDLLLQKAAARLEEVERDITELRLRRRSVEGSLEASIQALYSALEFIRDQDREREDAQILLHRPRQAGDAQPGHPHAQGERKAGA
jgi:cell division septum initiation protein DivIVA